MSSSVCIVIPAGAGLTPNSRAMPFADLCRTQTSGYVIRPSQSSGTASQTAMRSARWSAIDFGTSSPSTTLR